MKELLKNNSIVFGILLVLSFVIWPLTDAFFWKDDWYFLRAYLNNEEGFVIGQTFVSDVKPLFKYLMNFEFDYFKQHYQLYNYFSIFLFSIWTFTCFILLNDLIKNRSYSILITLFVAINPSNFMNLHCIMQQTELMHLIFLNLFFILSFRSAFQSNLMMLLGSGFCLLVAHLFFPNSLLMPFAGMLIIFLLSKNWKIRISSIITYMAVFALFLFHYSLLSSKYKLFEGENSIDLISAFIFSIQYTGITFLRIFLLTTQTYPEWLSFLTGSVVIGFYFFLYFKLSEVNRKVHLLLFIILIFSTGTVAIAREGNSVLYYYSQLHLISILWFTFQSILFLYPHLPNFVKLPKYQYSFLTVYVIVAIAQIQHSKNFFSQRNTLNKYITEINIKSEVEMPIFDEPIAAEGMKKYEDAYIKYKSEEGPKALALLISEFKNR